MKKCQQSCIRWCFTTYRNVNNDVFIIPIWPNNKVTITHFTVYAWSTIWDWSICNGFSDWSFQYGPVIKLPYGIDQSATVVADWSMWLFWHNIFTSFLVNLLLNPIGMLIPWLKKSWITNPKLLTWALTIQNSAFGVVLDCSISR